jgi:hypothetical protein
VTLLLSRLDSQVDLPPVVEQLLLDVVADGFTVYCCGLRAAPAALAADAPTGLGEPRWVRAARLPTAREWH